MCEPIKKGPRVIWYSTRGWVTRTRSINFIIRLRLDLGLRLLVFALTTNLESRPRFANIWFGPFFKICSFFFSSFFYSVYFLFCLRSLIAFFHVSKTLVVSGITFNVPSFKKLITFFFTFCSLSFFPLSSHYRVCQNNGLLWVKTKFLLKIVKGSIFDFIAFGFSLN